MYIAILLTLYVGLSIWGWYKPTTKKSYFNKKLKQAKWQIIETEFQRYQTKQAREELRLDYDKSKAKREALAKQIEEKKDGDEKKKMEDELTRLDLQIKRTEQGREEGDPLEDGMNLKNFDRMIATYNLKIDELKSYEVMIKDYIKEL